MDTLTLFSPWVNLSNWESLISRKEDRGGVYIFARFEDSPPSGPADPLDRRVVYIGQSSKSFKSHWILFYRGLRFPIETKYNPSKYPRALRYISIFGEDSPLPHIACLPLQHLKQAFLQPGSLSLLDLNAASYRGTVPIETFLDNNINLSLNYLEHRLIMLYTCYYGSAPAIQADKQVILERE
jgi:hypothetical protein